MSHDHTFIYLHLSMYHPQLNPRHCLKHIPKKKKNSVMLLTGRSD